MDNAITTEFEDIDRDGYMGHNGGLQFSQMTESDYTFRAEIQKIHLNSGDITHGGYIMTLMDSGLGTAVHRLLGGKKRIATISLDVKFVAASREGEILTGSASIIRKTRSMVFVRGDLRVGNRIVATADGIWKILS